MKSNEGNETNRAQNDHSNAEIHLDLERDAIWLWDRFFLPPSCTILFSYNQLTNGRAHFFFHRVLPVHES